MSCAYIVYNGEDKHTCHVYAAFFFTIFLLPQVFYFPFDLFRQLFDVCLLSQVSPLCVSVSGVWIGRGLTRKMCGEKVFECKDGYTVDAVGFANDIIILGQSRKEVGSLPY